MGVARICLLAMLITPALGQTPPAGRPGLNRFDVLSFEMSRGLHLDVGFSAFSESAMSPYSVLTPLYWSREYDEGVRLQSRFGTPPGQLPWFGGYAVPQVAVPGHPQFKLFEELRWPAASSLTGLQFQRQNLLVEGDRLSIRATGGRRAMLLWQLGEATHGVEWRVSARMQPRSDVDHGNIVFEAVRRF